jgi:polyhydroxyalkanoate synthesis regulator phasin
MATDAPRPGAWKTYLELAAGLGETSRKKVRKVVRDMVGKGNATAEQLKAITGEVLAAREANREALGKLIRVEVDRALGKVGLATMTEVEELTARVHDLEKQLREARAAQAAAASAAQEDQTPAPRTRTAKAATVAAISPVVKQATRKAAAANATIAKATGTVAAKATAARRSSRAATAQTTTTPKATKAPAKADRTSRRAEQ